MRILMRSGCSLLIFDLIIKWVKNYSRKKVTGNLWIDYGMESREKFLKTTSSIFDIERHKPRNRDVVVTRFDNRKIPVPTFDFVSAVTSLLHNDNVMAEENIIEGYDIMTGETDGCDFWDPATIQPLDLDNVPTPTDKTSKLGKVTTGYLYQEAVPRLCAQAHHVSIPIKIFYDKANLDRNGGLALAPLIFTLGFFKHKVCRVISGEYWPTSLISILVMANLVLSWQMTNRGNITRFWQKHCESFKKFVTGEGVKTTLGGKTVVLTFFVLFVVDDTVGHNDLCGNFQNNTMCPCRCCHCKLKQLSKLNSLQCKPVAMYDIRNSIVVADGLWKFPSVIAYQMPSTACQCPLGWVEYTGAHHGRLYMYSTKESLVKLLNIVDNIL